MEDMRQNVFTFPKSDRLCHRKTIGKIFSSGKSEFIYPFKLLYLTDPSPISVRIPPILFSIPKKNFKNAVHRNQLRRQLKEIYRLHKPIIMSSYRGKFPSSIAVIYIGKEILTYLILEQKLISILNRLKSIE